MKKSVKTITMTGICTAILCILSVIAVFIGQIPYTLALLGVFFIGGVLSPVYAGMACFCYLLLGVVGLPVFSGFTGGVGVLLGPTGGFLLAYPFMAMLLSWIRTRFKNRTAGLLIGMLLALLLGYTFGAGWFMLITKSTFVTALTACILPFFWFDGIKITLSLIILKTYTKHFFPS